MDDFLGCFMMSSGAVMSSTQHSTGSSCTIAQALLLYKVDCCSCTMFFEREGVARPNMSESAPSRSPRHRSSDDGLAAAVPAMRCDAMRRHFTRRGSIVVLLYLLLIDEGVNVPSGTWYLGQRCRYLFRPTARTAAATTTATITEHDVMAPWQ